MNWERSDLNAAKMLKEIIRNTELKVKGADLVNTTLSVQWFDRLVDFIKDEVGKPKPKTQPPKTPGKKDKKGGKK